MACSMKEVVALLLLQLGNINSLLFTFKGIDLLLEVLWIEVGGFERNVFVWIILRVRHSPPSSIIMYS